MGRLRSVSYTHLDVYKRQDKAIEAHLLANGLTRDSQEFADQSMQLRTENNVASLPIR